MTAPWQERTAVNADDKAALTADYRAMGGRLCFDEDLASIVASAGWPETTDEPDPACPWAVSALAFLTAMRDEAYQEHLQDNWGLPAESWAGGVAENH